MIREFAGTLTERIEIDRPVTTRTVMGMQEAGWERVCRCLAAIVLEGAGPEAEAMALSAMPRFRVTIRWREGIAIDQRIRWRERTLMVRQLLDDPGSRDRLVLRCEEIRA